MEADAAVAGRDRPHSTVDDALQSTDKTAFSVAFGNQP